MGFVGFGSIAQAAAKLAAAFGMRVIALRRNPTAADEVSKWASEQVVASTGLLRTYLLTSLVTPALAKVTYYLPATTCFRYYTYYSLAGPCAGGGHLWPGGGCAAFCAGKSKCQCALTAWSYVDSTVHIDCIHYAYTLHPHCASTLRVLVHTTCLQVLHANAYMCMCIHVHVHVHVHAHVQHVVRCRVTSWCRRCLPPRPHAR